MSIAQMVHNEVAKKPLGIPFTVEGFKNLGNWSAVQRSLSRMAHTGEISRLSRGIYAKPRMYKEHKIVRIGAELIECIERTTGETVIAGGGHATNILGISTQVQMVEMYYWTGRTKTIFAGGRTVQLNYINKKFANKSHPLLELFLSSAYYLGNKLFTVAALQKAELRLGKEKMLELKPYIEVMPKWVGRVFQQYFEWYK